jgi:hypothetical protein
MRDNRLTKAANIRKHFLDNLTEEDCITIIENSGIELNFQPIKVKRVVYKGKEELRYGGREELYLVPVAHIKEALRLNNQSIYTKVSTTNCIEFEDKYFGLGSKSDESKIAVITPKGVILYSLCTHGNEYVSRIEYEAYKFQDEKKGNKVKDELAHVFKRAS